MAYKELIIRLTHDPEFQGFVKDELIPAMPTVPSYNPSNENVERWKYDSGMREGYLLALQLLGVKNG